MQQQIQEITGVNRASDEIRSGGWNWIKRIMRKDREVLWSGGQRGGEDQVDQKNHGGAWLKTKCKQLDGSHGRLSEF